MLLGVVFCLSTLFQHNSNYNHAQPHARIHAECLFQACTSMRCDVKNSQILACLCGVSRAFVDPLALGSRMAFATIMGVGPWLVHAHWIPTNVKKKPAAYFQVVLHCH